MTWPLAIRRVEGQSMLPQLEHGQVVVVGRWFRPAKVGDVVVISHNGLEKIKRIVEIQNELIFVAGDNSKYSTDSYDFGWLDRTTIVAKLLWPRA